MHGERNIYECIHGERNIYKLPDNITDNMLI